MMTTDSHVGSKTGISELLDKLAALVPAGIQYPKSLLERFDLKKPFDREIHGYLTVGGEAGAYYHWLTHLARLSDAKTIVELGNRHGTSTLALYHGLKPDTRLISIDVMKDQRYVPPMVYNDARVQFLIGDCLDLSLFERSKIAIPMNIDILWTDTIHTYPQLSTEIAVYEPLLSDEALIVVDDIHLNDKHRVFEETPHRTHDLTALCHVSGFGAIHYVRPMAERGKSNDERFLAALKRSAQIGFNNYWALYNEFDGYKTEYEQHLLRNVAQRAYRKLRRLLHPNP